MRKKVLSALLCAFAALPATAETLKIAIQGGLPPFDYTEAGKVKGFNVDITHALCADMKVTCVVVKTPWENLIPDVASGKVDAAISSVAITEERKKKVLFSDKYTQSPGSFVGKKGKYVSTFITELDLKGKKVGYQSNTIFENLVKGRFPNIPQTGYHTTAEMYRALSSGEIDIALDDMVSAYYGFLQSPEGKGYELVGSAIRDRKYMGVGEGVVLKLGNQALAKRFNQSISHIRETGIYQQIMNKYFMFNVY
ncbi:transporter substrate-binding domain-containing protein [Leeia sp. TBRC 13508]|uniref:Transporter substrate-binding domain-containing protein n=1 Tax=Leeia speluncae TaxID=2884804 RepID=A0ABS8D4B4_9NEIS|nr:transporter substrate-binding domain-containing protein [Leeia speluncae]MCB6183035.1 transporter substrate-binding domain-containing protein [Leeia speluncae]